MRCMILAAGYGTRLNPLTLERPKPLMEILGTSIIELQIEALRKWHVSEVMLNLHYLGEQLQARLGNEFMGVKIHYSYEEEILGTGGGLKKVEQFFAAEKSFLLLHGDVLIDLDIKALMGFHTRHNPISTMVLKNVTDFKGTRPVGSDSENQVSCFLGISTKNPTIKERMFCGVHALSPQIFSSLPANTYSCVTAEAYPQLLAQGKVLMAFNYDGYFSDIGTIDQYFDTNMKLLSGEIRLKNIDVFSRFSRIGPRIYSGKNTKIKSHQIIGPCLIDDGATINPSAQIGPFAIIGKNAVIEEGAQVKNAILLSNSHVKAGEIMDGEIRSQSHSVIIDRKHAC